MERAAPGALPIGGPSNDQVDRSHVRTGQGGSKIMVKQITRRSRVKGAAGAGLGMASLGAASSTFAAPSVIQDGPVEVSFLRAFPSGANGDASVAMIERFHEAFPDIKIVENVVDDYEAVAAQLITGLQTG